MYAMKNLNNTQFDYLKNAAKRFAKKDAIKTPFVGKKQFLHIPIRSNVNHAKPELVIKYNDQLSRYEDYEAFDLPNGNTLVTPLSKIDGTSVPTPDGEHWFRSTIYGNTIVSAMETGMKMLNY